MCYLVYLIFTDILLFNVSFQVSSDESEDGDCLESEQENSINDTRCTENHSEVEKTESFEETANSVETVVDNFEKTTDHVETTSGLMYCTPIIAEKQKEETKIASKLAEEEKKY